MYQSHEKMNTIWKENTVQMCYYLAKDFLSKT